ncbi:hypothetical protein PHYBOEH_005408 [Phytophthora boehmeriae]|uniref:Uncharacterized protein n=1 Tax=Phytophthora boehmeriae TaxID=109152 RepID=A0A8T1WLL5_9STRA|nr:hypothetical protein PHYBOEH_005408 [Phytophthora boehmeriae]
MAPPEDGSRANYLFWLRDYLTIALMTRVILEQFRITVPGLHINWWHVIIMPVISSGGAIAFMTAMSSFIGFPLPFALVVGIPVWFIVLVICFVCFFGRVLRRDPPLLKELLRSIVVLILQVLLTFVYPAYLFGFVRVGASGQKFYVMLLPVIKIIAKNWISYCLGKKYDLMPQIMIFNVDVFNALYVSSSMQNSNSIVTMLQMIALDALLGWVSISDISHLMRDVLVLQRKIPAHHPLKKASFVEIALQITEEDPDTRGYLALRRYSTSRVILKRASAGGPSATAFAVTSNISTKQVLPVEPPKESLPTAPVAKAPSLRLDPAPKSKAESGASKTLLNIFTLKERQRFLKQSARVLFTTEFVILVEYTEVIVPFIFTMYSLGMFYLPNHDYYPQIHGYDDTNRKLRISMLFILSFVLDVSWRMVQSNLFLWICYTIQNSLEHNGLTDSCMSELLQSDFSKKIVKLYLRSNALTDKTAIMLGNALPHMKIEVLSLAGNTVGDCGAASLAFVLDQSPALQTLDLDENQIGQDGIMSFYHVVNGMTVPFQLRYLHLERNPAAPEGVLKQIRLKLHEKIIETQICFGPFANVEPMTTLTLSGSKIKRDILLESCLTDLYVHVVTRAIRTSPRWEWLEVLDLSGNEIGEKGVYEIGLFLALQPPLQVLNLSSNWITDKAISGFADGIEPNTKLQELLLDHNQITDAGAKQLYLQAFKANQQRRIRLSVGNQLTSECKVMLAAISQAHDLRKRFAKEFANVEKLDFSGRALRQYGASAIVEELVATSTSKCRLIDFSRNGLGDEGAQAVALLLRSYPRLEELDLSFNDIGDEGAFMIAEALTENSTLLSLSFHSAPEGSQAKTKLSDKGLCRLAHAIQSHKALTKIDLRDNVTSPTIVRAYVEMLRRNPSIQKFNVSPFPCLLLVTAIDCAPMAPPEDGSSANYLFWARDCLSIALMTRVILEQFRVSVPGLHINWLQIVAMPVISSGGAVMFMIAMASIIGFPLPFALVIGIPVWFVVLIICFACFFGRVLRQDSKLFNDLKTSVVVLIVQVLLTFVYPAYLYGFVNTGTSGQKFYVMLLPIIKLVVKNWISHLLGNKYDLMPQIMIFNVDVFNALYVSSSMQNSSSISTMLAMITVDAVQGWVSISDIGHFMRDVDSLRRKIPVDHPLQSASFVVIALQIIKEDTQAKAHLVRRRYSSARAIILKSRLSSGDSENSLGASADNPTTPNRRVIPVSTQGPALPVAAIETFTPLHQNGSTKPETLMGKIFSPRERWQFVHKTAQILFTTEFVVLVEYTEVIVPFIYTMYTIGMFYQSNRAYYPQLDGLDEKGLRKKLRSVATFGMVELLSLFVIGYLIQRRIGISILRLLSFVLDRSWRMVQSNLFLWIFYTITNSLEHNALVVSGPWLGFMTFFLFKVCGVHIRTNPETYTDIKQLAAICGSQISMILVYTVITTVFTTLSPTYQPVFSLIIPGLKVVQKNILSRILKDCDDTKPQVVIFNVEIFNALFISSCMQNAQSIATSITLITVDLMQAAISLYDLHCMVHEVQDTMIKIGVKTNRLIDVGALIMKRYPATANRQSLVNIRDLRGWEHSAIPIALMGPKVNQVAPHFHKDEPSPPTLKSGKSQGPTIANVISTEKVDASTPPRTASVTTKNVAAALDSLTPQEHHRVLKKALQVLFLTEFLLLIEFTEVLIPVLYSLYVLILYHWPNRRFYPQLASLTDAELRSIVGSILTYGVLELGSLVLLVLVLYRTAFRYPLQQLAFVLEREFLMVQPKLVLWVILTLQSTLPHLGADYTFQFKWLHHNSSGLHS